MTEVELIVSTNSVPHRNVPQALTMPFAYRHRIRITVFCVIAGLCGTLLTSPDIQEGTSLDHVFDGVGWFLLGSSMLLRLWASRHISGRKTRSLVSTGPYAVCRNPQYIGTLLIAVSQLLILKSWPFALACVIPIVMYVVGVVPTEERWLQEQLGADYSDYCRLVPRWSLRWRGLNLEWGSPEKASAFRRECVTCAWWLLLPLASEFFAGLREWISSAA